MDASTSITGGINLDFSETDDCLLMVKVSTTDVVLQGSFKVIGVDAIKTNPVILFQGSDPIEYCIIEK